MSRLNELFTWADNTRIITIPRIEFDVGVLKTRQSDLIGNLASFTSSFQYDLDRLKLLAGALQDANEHWDGVIGDAMDGIIIDKQLTEQEIADRVQEIKDLVAQGIANVKDIIDMDVRRELDAKIAAELIDVNLRIDGAMDRAQSLSDSFMAKFDSFMGLSDDLLDGTLPILGQLTGNLSDDVVDIRARLDLIMADFGHSSVILGIDAVRAENESYLNTMGGNVLRAPRSYWTSEADLPYAHLDKPFFGAQGDLITDDVVFGEAFKFRTGNKVSIGPAFPQDFVPGRVYKLEANIRVTSNGPSEGGSKIALGVTTQKGTTISDANSRGLLDKDAWKVQHGQRALKVYISTDGDALERYGIEGSSGIHLENSDDANKIYFWVQQNHDETTDGKVIVGSIFITDVTEVLSGIDIIRTELNAIIGDSESNITDILMAISDLEGSLAQAKLDLESTIGDVSANLTDNYMTAVNTQGAIASATTTLEGTINDTIGGRIDSIEALDITEGTSFGALMNQLQVDNTGSSATISSIGNAIADANGDAQATWGFKAKAGSANSEFVLSAMSEGGDDLSAARIRADSIILDGSIYATALDDGAVTTTKIRGGAITTDKIAAWAIESDKIAANAITAAKIATNAITISHINEGAITSDKIADGAVTKTQILGGTITSDLLATNSIISTKIAAGAITTDSMGANSIQGDRIAANTLNANKIIANSITASQIRSNTITSTQISSNTITATQMRANTITANSGIIANAAVDTLQIRGNAVTIPGVDHKSNTLSGGGSYRLANSVTFYMPQPGHVYMHWVGGNEYPNGIPGLNGSGLIPFDFYFTIDGSNVFSRSSWAVNDFPGASYMKSVGRGSHTMSVYWKGNANLPTGERIQMRRRTLFVQGVMR